MIFMVKSYPSKRLISGTHEIPFSAACARVQFGFVLADLAGQAGARDRQRGGGRRGRRHRAGARRAAGRDAGPGLPGGEPRRRRRLHRLRRGGALRCRRPCAALLARLEHDDRAAHREPAGPRSAEGAGAGGRHRARFPVRDRASGAAVQEFQGIPGLRARQSGQAELRVARQRHLAAHRHRGVQPRGQGEAEPRALQGRGPGAAGPARGADPAGVRSGRRPRAGPRGQGAHDRDRRPGAPPGLSRRSHPRGERHQGRGRRAAFRLLCAVRDAARAPRQNQFRSDEGNAAPAGARALQGAGGRRRRADVAGAVRRLRARRACALCEADSGAGNQELTQDIILETRGLTKEFKGFVAVKDVSLKVRRGSIHALIGPNGAGKTTCFNLLTHFLEPTRGQIFFKGREITGSAPARIARMGLVRSFQISAVFPHLTVLENVRIALQRKRGRSFDFWRSDQVLKALDKTARELVSDVNLSEFEETVAVELPYGRKRALEIATTLALDPEMMLLDEPTAGMTHADVDRIAALIKRVSANRTVLMVEHNLSVVSTLSDTITVLQRGEILAEGDYATVSKNPQVIEAYLGSGAQDSARQSGGSGHA